MDAIVLVGGMGTRLRPLTDRRHKSLVPLCNRPAFEYLLDWLAAGGIERVILALGQGNGDLAHAYPEGQRGSLEIRHAIEHERLESGGAIRHAATVHGVDRRFVVLNGDIYLESPLAGLLAAHDRAGAELSIALHEVDDVTGYGVAVTSSDGRINAFVEKPSPAEAPSRLVNAGAWIFEPGLLDELAPAPSRVEETLFPDLVARGRGIYGHRITGVWADLGTPQRYLTAHRQLLARAAGKCAIAAGAEVHAEAAVRLSAVGEGSQIRAGAAVEGSVLWEQVEVGAGASVRGSILADGVVIGAGARVSDAVLGPGTTVAAGAELPPGTTVNTGERYH